MKLKFSASDFPCAFDFGVLRLTPTDAAKLAQAKYDHYRANATLVYGYDYSHMWSLKRDKINGESPIKIGRLIEVEEIECQHKRTQIWEPHLAGARKCLDCNKVYTPNRTPNWQMECVEHVPNFEQERCLHCNKKLKQTWTVVDE